MSTFLNTARARTLRPGGGLPRPRLTIVPKVAVRAPGIPFALMVVTVLAAGLISGFTRFTSGPRSRSRDWTSRLLGSTSRPTRPSSSTRGGPARP